MGFEFKTEEKQLGEHAYRVRQMDARTGAPVLARLVKTLGPALTGDLGAALAALDEETFLYFCDRLTANAEVNLGGKWLPVKDQFSTLFAGNYGELLELLNMAGRLNFASFFDGLKRIKLGAE